MAHATLLNDNLAHKLTLALLQDSSLPSARYTELLGRITQVLADVRSAYPDDTSPVSGALALTATDALAIVSGCLDSSGGYREDLKAVASFNEGVQRVYDAIDLQAKAGFTSFDSAIVATELVLSELYENFTAGAAGASERYDGAKTAHLLLEAASHYGLADGQVLAAHQIGTKRPLTPAAQEAAVPKERGEELLSALEDSIASPAAGYLRSCILAGDKDEALKALSEERMTGQDAEDLYAFCRQKWLGKRLALVEVPQEQSEEIVRKNLQTEDDFDDYGPSYLVRRGKSVVNGYSTKRAGKLWLNLGGSDRVEVKEVPQLWMVVELP